MKIYDLDEATRALEREMDQRRFLHSLGVMQTAVILAQLNGFDTDRAAVAGLLHDCVKDKSRDELLLILSDPGEALNEYEQLHPGLLHAPAGAQYARQAYGVTDAEVLDAIAHHPAGKPAASPTLRVLMAADYCEPTRVFSGVEKYRMMVREDLNSGLKNILNSKIEHLKQEGKQPHGDIYAMLEWLQAA